MVDISVNNLTKFFVIGENLLEGLTFDIQEGECVAILGRNGCGKTTLFKILTGEMDYDDGQVFVNPNKRMGLISQIPKFPAGFTVEDVLRSAYADLMKIKSQMEFLEQAMSAGATADQLREYDKLTNRFQSGGGYEMDVEVDKICNGLGITPEQRRQEFDSLSGGEKTRKRRIFCCWMNRRTTWIYAAWNGWKAISIILRELSLSFLTTAISSIRWLIGLSRSPTAMRNSTPVIILSTWTKSRLASTCS